MKEGDIVRFARSYTDPIFSIPKGTPGIVVKVHRYSVDVKTKQRIRGAEYHNGATLLNVGKQLLEVA